MVGVGRAIWLVRWCGRGCVVGHGGEGGAAWLVMVVWVGLHGWSWWFGWGSLVDHSGVGGAAW